MGYRQDIALFLGRNADVGGHAGADTLIRPVELQKGPIGRDPVAHRFRRVDGNDAGGERFALSVCIKRDDGRIIEFEENDIHLGDEALYLERAVPDHGHRGAVRGNYLAHLGIECRNNAGEGRNDERPRKVRFRPCDIRFGGLYVRKLCIDIGGSGRSALQCKILLRHLKGISGIFPRRRGRRERRGGGVDGRACGCDVGDMRINGRLRHGLTRYRGIECGVRSRKKRGDFRKVVAGPRNCEGEVAHGREVGRFLLPCREQGFDENTLILKSVFEPRVVHERYELRTGASRITEKLIYLVVDYVIRGRICVFYLVDDRGLRLEKCGLIASDLGFRDCYFLPPRTRFERGERRLFPLQRRLFLQDRGPQFTVLYFRKDPPDGYGLAYLHVDTRYPAALRKTEVHVPRRYYLARERDLLYEILPLHRERFSGIL